MDSIGRARGRGRVLTENLSISKDETTRPFNFSRVTSASCQSSEEKIDRANAAPVIISAPRGKGVGRLVSEFPSLRISERANSSGRGTPWSNCSLPKTKPSHIEDKRGVSGDPINIVANYIRILSKPCWQLFQYHVDFNPEEMLVQRKMRREMILQHKNVLKDVAFDGTTLYSFENLGQDRMFSCRHLVTGDPVEMRLRLTAQNSTDSPNFFHLANLIVRKLLELSGLKLIGRNYYQFDRKIDLERYRLTLFPGFLTNVNIYEGSLMINVDLSHKVLNKTTVFNRLQDIFTQFVDYKRAQDESTKELVGQIVLTTYNSKTYRIDEISWDKSPRSVFRKRDGTEESLIKYYHDRYQITIEDSTQPLLISKPSKKDRRAGQTAPLMLIPELCCVTGISDVMRSDFQFMKELSDYTHIAPSDRWNKLSKFADDLEKNPKVKEELKKWDIELDHGLIEFDGRLLESEQILYADRSIRYRHDEADWSRDGRNLRHIASRDLNHWFVFYPSNLREIGEDFLSVFFQIAGPFGMKINQPNIIQLANDRPETYLTVLPEKLDHKTDFVLCILPNSRKDRYDALKKYLCLDNPIPSQMIIAKTISKKNQLVSVATKIGIQINAKLGGEIWAVTIPSKTLMIIGMDSYHDSKRKGASVGAFVASTNVTCTRFYSRIIYNRTAQELMDGLQQCMRDALKEFHRVNNFLPEKIVLYRDGVSDGQLNVVAEHELPQIIDTFPKIMPGYQPKLAVVIVKKRGNARFFAKIGSHGIINPPPGTIIDHTVTNAEWYDFYLISQSVKQGTVSPTHYNVIWDRTNLKVDHMQRLTFKLTHLYYNWPGTIRVPAVCQYAHKLAFLVGQTLHQDFHPELADRLFYL